LILGAILGYLFYFTGSIWISIIAHFVNNAVVVIMGFFSSEKINLNPLEKGKDEWEISFGWPLAMLSLILIFGVFYYLKKLGDKKNSP
jgi:membrane protease YdiL (CAAX protease family)